MKSFLDELRIIPGMVWLISLALAGLVLLLLTTHPPSAIGLSGSEYVFFVCVLLFIFAWVLIIGYVFVDARRRGMRHVMWTLLSIFIPYGIGIILYFVLRDPQMIPCPKCSTLGRPSYVFCTQCGGELSPSCPACKRAVELSWNRCAYCGRELSDRNSQEPSLSNA